ncbi:hypothetical protein E3Q18_02098 [Wallemia mellicola]|uniref:Vacuolar protein sorting-associated protein 1 n=1 Tax=Wallemia mellicola TaxID=1708541 RepID=A0A4T0PM66_9BASI|nr:hypothetical protein E3Q24_03832 [Wallemia mellicola]TIB76348.1 hypothetical protein E3Q23_01906 [Wallemia mellicola]TIB80097.1 hypothetical protein E3Q21_03912 [Wallemia mellicola]TIB84020.1 hypothetical protein E3Q20_03865 [Wallemia mellicola]TIB98394.1 hypothetical protein E3Q18_02098 [Wallemia mellicola]
MSTTLKALSKKRAASDDEADAPATKKPIQNKQRVLVLSSRGVTERYRHLMSDLQALLPHTKKDSKISSKTSLATLNELADLASCNNIMFFETKHHAQITDLYLWLAKAPNGPSVKFHLQNLHTMDELKMTGNCLKGSRGILSFGEEFDSEPWLQLLKELFTHTFGVPRTSRRVKPFFDHVLSFSYLDGKIWFRSHQIVEKDATTIKAELGNKNKSPATTLVEIGPRFVLTPIRIFEGSFGGPTVFSNPEFLPPTKLRKMEREKKAEKYSNRKDTQSESKQRKKDISNLDKGLAASNTLKILSAGDILRKNVRMGTPLGQKADKVIKQGSLLPDDVMLKLLTSELEKVHDYHWILDGFPRTIGQGQLLDKQLESNSINLVINLDVPDSIILDRIQQRWIHEKSGRVYNLGYNPPKVAGKDDVTGEALTQRDDDNVDAFTNVGIPNPIDLPQITVIGSQSSGKSSVLENIVGRDFLPRGTGIVTRRPLVLQLINRPATSKKDDNEQRTNENNPDEWGEFLHLPGEKFHDFDKIRDEIVRDTELKTGKNAGISPLPINLRIFSPNVLTLTLVDLPGMTRVPVGDQPRDIERQIRDMLYKFVSKPNAVILAVTAANTDLANSDGLKLAREVDPEGTRTIGVLSKVDLMDAGTDVVDILAGRVIPLRLGYVPVVNRGQRDIEQKRAISSALETEKSFFENHNSYRSKAQYCGTPFLTRKLNMILMHHIKSCLPDIKAKISASLAKFQAELQSLGGAHGEGNGANVVLTVITDFCNEFRTVIDGNTHDLSLQELSGGARISFCYHELFNNGVKSIDPFDQVKDGDIRTILYNSSGSTPALFVGTTAFEIIVKQQIRRLEEPAIKCCALIYEELIRILSQLLGKIQSFKRYPALKERFNSVVIASFKKAMEPTQKLVTDMVNMQACYINTTHPDFLSGHKAMALVTERQQQAQKAPPPAVDPKTGKLAPGVLNNNRDLDVDTKKEEPSFFGSFFSKTGAGAQKKKSGPIMESPPPQIRPQSALNDREALETEVIKMLITSYFNIVKREMIDMVPKAITYTLVQKSKDQLQRELLQELYKNEVLDDLMKESDFVVQRRKECIKMVEALNKAEEIISTV